MSLHPSTGVMLFVPASDASKVAKIPALDADSIILDLEDAVPSHAKESARTVARDAIERWGSERQLWVRINAEDQLLDADLDAVTRRGLAGIIVPKAGTGSQIDDIGTRLAVLERSARLEDAVRLSPTIESVSGVLAADEVAASSPRVAFLSLGLGDLSLDYGIDWPIDVPDHPLVVDARVRLVQASRIAGLVGPHDGAYPRPSDPAGLRGHSKFARSLGFSSKHAIHPAQVPVIRDAFTPSAEEIERAQQIVEEFEAARADGVGAISVAGSLVDYPVWRRACAVLAAVRR